MRSCAVIIPAYNEEQTIAEVVRVAQQADIGPVLVVDDASHDATATQARQAGAQLLSLPRNVGKGGAVHAGASALEQDAVILLDADLLGLSAEHIHKLANPVLQGDYDMTRGVFSGGRWRTSTAQRLAPQLNGQRCVLRSKLLEVEALASSRYGLEIAISEHAQRRRWHCCDVDMPGVSQIMKEEKRGFWQGTRLRCSMYGDIVKTWLQHRLG